VFEQINSAYSKKVAINVAFPIPVKKETKSQPVLMNSICITDGNVTFSIAACKTGVVLEGCDKCQ